MGKKHAYKPYKLSITVEELQDKKYRKYLYPEIIDGITFEDEVERKLSESSWFRCLEPKQQLIVEKEMRLRAKGEFNHPFLHYEDSLNEPAPAIPKAVMTRLTQSLTPLLFTLLFQMIPYIHVNDGSLKNKKRQNLTIEDIAKVSDAHASGIRTLNRLKMLSAHRVIFFSAGSMTYKETVADVYSDFAELSQYDKAVVSAFNDQRELLIYINPFICFFGQYIDAYTLPYFVNSGWYVVNPYAPKIKDWIEKNCN